MKMLVGLTGCAFLALGPFIVVTALVNPYPITCLLSYIAIGTALSVTRPFDQPFKQPVQIVKPPVTVIDPRVADLVNEYRESQWTPS